ncbi:hypothetical protein LTR49_028258, partial [Elasticomyces elasticus]
MIESDIKLKLSQLIKSYGPDEPIEAFATLSLGGCAMGEEYSMECVQTIKRDPAVCEVCTNLDWHVANALDSGSGTYIWVDPDQRAVRIVATLGDVSGEAEEGCGSCSLVRECAVRLFGVDIDSECDSDFELVYCRNAILTISLESSAYKLELFTLK